MKKRSALTDLMVKLSMDPALRQQYQEDPSTLLAEAGLSEEELAVVAGGNPHQIRSLLGGDAPIACFIMFVQDETETPLAPPHGQRPV